MVRKIYYLAAPNFRFLVRKLYYFPLDYYEIFTGKRNKNVPKKGDIFIGQQQVNLLKKHVDLQPSHQVLDVGCGIGRTAYALTTSLEGTGSYDGFDAVKKGIDWCNKNIKSQFSNFNFYYIPLRNRLYNKSTINPETFQFPYQENTFDRVFLFSVFTHMKIADIQNYLAEINRVLKADGQCLATFFTYSEDDKLEDFPGFKFPIKRDYYRLLDKKVEEANIAIEINFLRNMVEKSGLKFERKIGGFWNDFTKDRLDINFQDIIILKK